MFATNLNLNAQDAKSSSRYQVPKYSPSYKRSSKDLGPHPGSKAPAGTEGAVFKRIYAEPAAIRLLVRANCGTRLGRRELIERARKLSTREGPVQHIDWEPIRGDRATFWVVASARRKVVKLELRVEEGKYKSAGEKVTPQEYWEVTRLSIGTSNANCVEEKKLTTHQLRTPVVNFLNHFTLGMYRKPSDEYPTAL